MKCAYCNNEDTRVIETRESVDATRRRRECHECERRFTTYERPEMGDIIIIKKDGERVPFDREKIRKGMVRACEKRPVTDDEIERAVDEVENSFRRRKGREFTTRQVGSLVLKKLKKLDKVAYIRFASVYREFSDVASFESELKKIIKKKA